MVAVFSHRQTFFSIIQCIKGLPFFAFFAPQEKFPVFAGVTPQAPSPKPMRNGAAWSCVITGDR